jgi:prevent-host-death family protein
MAAKKRTQMGMFAAKTHFSEVVAAAERGVTTTITRNGKPVAEISPVRSDGREEARAAMERLRALAHEILEQNGGPVPREEILEMVHSARKYLDDRD